MSAHIGMFIASAGIMCGVVSIAEAVKSCYCRLPDIRICSVDPPPTPPPGQCVRLVLNPYYLSVLARTEIGEDGALTGTLRQCEYKYGTLNPTTGECDAPGGSTSLTSGLKDRIPNGDPCAFPCEAPPDPG
jgi:hypothetical protein